MQRTWFSAAVAIFFSFSATHAAAQADLPASERPKPPEVIGSPADRVFDGVFVGGSLGYGRDIVTPALQFTDNDSDNALASIFIGYDKTLGEEFVIGVEAGVGLGIDDDVVVTGIGEEFTYDPQREITATARFGYLLTPDTLIFARGGYATVRADVTGPTETVSDDFTGFVLGGGFEYEFARNLTTRLEFRYQDLSRDNVDVERSLALFSIAYRF